jgi:acyl carrier protein phosphodiesterase
LFDQASVSRKLGAFAVGDHQFAAARELMRQCFRDEFETLDDILSKTARSNDPRMHALHDRSEQVRNQYQAVYEKFLARGLTDSLH